MKILILDIETTGFLQSGGKIVEVGIVELNLLNGDVSENITQSPSVLIPKRLRVAFDSSLFSI